MTDAGYFSDMKIIDERLTSCENKLAKLEIAVRKVLKLLEVLQEWQPLQSHSE